MCHPTGRENSRHDQDSSPINDQQGALESNADPYALHDVVSSLNRKRRVLFPLYLIPGLSEIRSSVSNTFVQSHYRQTRLLVPVILHLRDLVTGLQSL